MLAGPTVLILGAGSSTEFDLPTGLDLASWIRTLLSFRFNDFGRFEDGNRDFYRILQNHFGQDVEITNIAQTIAQGVSSFNSIDDFLFTHSDDKRIIEMGKMAIVFLIAQAEGKSVVKNLFHHDLDSRLGATEIIGKTWIGTLFRLLSTGVARSNVEALFKDLTIVTFNYDRCVEAILYNLMQPAFGIDEKSAIEIVNTLKIYRPYGGLGPLSLGNNPGTEFGPNLSSTSALASRIRVYTEELGDRPDLVEMRKILADSWRVIYLGFGFHKQNMQLLDITDEPSPTAKMVYATAYKEPAPARKTITDRLIKATPDMIDTQLSGSDVDCKQFFDDYQMLFAG